MRPTMNQASLLTLGVAALTACSSHVVVEPAPRPRASQGPSTAATLGIPPGHLPRPGYCRVWFPGRPPGHQPRQSSCAEAERNAPAGSWILYRPRRDRKVIQVREVGDDNNRRGTIVRIRIYVAATGEFLRDGNDQDRDQDREDDSRDRHDRRDRDRERDRDR